jgi:hypothetical protein
MKENDGGGAFKYDIFEIYCKNFCKCHKVPPLSTTIKKKKHTLYKGRKDLNYFKYQPVTVALEADS